MNKNLFFVAAAALAFAACSQSETLIDETESPEVAIGFDTYTPTMTRADDKADNSTSTSLKALEDHHESFRVWGFKYIGTTNATEKSVFLDKQTVTATKNSSNQLDGNWTYTPGRYWDKSADHYTFYAAAPYSDNWELVGDAKTTRTIKYQKFALGGQSLGAAEYEKNGVDANASFKSLNETDVDLMLAHDVPSHKTYTSDAVNLQFDHILSRLNIGVAKADVSEKIYLNSITLVGHKSNGTFVEGTTVDASGTIARWATDLGANQTTYALNDKIGYHPTDATELKAYDGTTDGKKKYNYVYQGLIIPQEVAVQSDLKLDGSNLGTTPSPYLKLVYTVEYKAASGTDPAVTEEFTYFYNLAYLFTKSSASATAANFKFCEGYQNNLNILISPAKINFDAQVYEWATKQSSDYTVPDGPQN